MKSCSKYYIRVCAYKVDSTGKRCMGHTEKLRVLQKNNRLQLLPEIGLAWLWLQDKKGNRYER